MSLSRERRPSTTSTQRVWSRWMTVVVGLGVAVVGLAAPASAHHNTITAQVTCRDGGGWNVAWRVTNSEGITETITASTRPSVVPVGTTLTSRQTREFVEAVTTRPTSDLTLSLAARWSNGQTAQNSGSISSRYFSEDCLVRTVDAPTVPVLDECGPGNATFGPVPNGPWTWRKNPNGSLTIYAVRGYTFPGGVTSVTIPAPVDSNQPCPTPPTPTPTPTPTPPEVLPVQASAVKAQARKIDKCGRRSDLYKVAERAGVVYTVRGKVVKQGTWLRARTRKVVIRAQVADASAFTLVGKQVWRMSFTNRACAKAPEVAPATGA